MAWVRLLVVAGLVGVLMVEGVAAADGAISSTAPETQLVTISEVRVQITEQGPVVLLTAEGRTITIFVDVTVAGSIQGALSGVKLPRPMSHDLMHSIMESTGARVTQTVITLKGSTYFGALTVAVNGQERVFDSRSSDSIALAVHFKAPILVGRDLLESAGRILPESKKQEL